MARRITKQYVTRGIAGMNREKIEQIVEKSREIDRKIKEVKGNSTIGRFVNRLKLFRMMIRDYWQGRYTGVPWRTVAAVAFALFYFFNPFDLVPDFIPGLGYVDDVAVLAIVWKATEEDLKQYVRSKRLALKAYFD